MLIDHLKRPRILIPGSFLLICIVYILSSPSISLLSSPTKPFPKFPQETYTYPSDLHPGAHNQTRPKRVAIVGAGASGSAAAWFLRRAGDVIRDRTGKEVLGSTIVYPHGDERLRPIELGASIFVDANKHMTKAAKRFGLNTVDPDFGESGIGIWDGTSFLYKTSPSTSWWSDYLTTLSALRRYGPSSPLRTRKAITNLLSKFANLYNPTWLAQRGAVGSVEEFAEKVELGNEMTTRFGVDWAESLGLGEKWIGEIMEGSTRCNYAADMDGIHGLAAGVSMAAAGAKAVEGGNWRVFEGMLRESKANLRLQTQVKDIVPRDHSYGSRTFIVTTNTSSLADEEPFDQVFWAAPWLNSPNDRGLKGLTANLEIPIHITYHGETYPNSGEYVVKIFSKTRLTDRFIRELLGEEPTWLLRKGWNSYPIMKPVAEYAGVEPVKGVQYLGGMETWVST